MTSTMWTDMLFDSKKDAVKFVGGLSVPSKMPCYGYSLPAYECNVGSKLRQIKGSVCSGCYALKGRYVFPTVKTAMERRFETIFEPAWVEAMSLITKDMPYFRWHDSGDIQNVLHLDKICQIAKNSPKCKFWLPTRENNICRIYFAFNKCPKNLCVRISGSMMDGKAPYKFAELLDLQVSEVRTTGWDCPASLQDNKCNDCRKCWDKKNFCVSYKRH